MHYTISTMQAALYIYLLINSTRRLLGVESTLKMREIDLLRGDVALATTPDSCTSTATIRTQQCHAPAFDDVYVLALVDCSNDLIEIEVETDASSDHRFVRDGTIKIFNFFKSLTPFCA